MAERQSYHHGNLREALVEAAVELIEQTGPQAFTLAEAARRAGVSPAAPYRHFKGRDDLLEEVAKRGFCLFAEKVHAAYDGGLPNPLRALGRVGSAYLEFASENPGYYTAMFESNVAVVSNPELWEISERAFGVLVRAAEALAESLPKDERPPARMVANHIWALSHGVVELFSRSKNYSRTPVSPEDMLSSGVLIYLRGLKLISH